MTNPPRPLFLIHGGERLPNFLGTDLPVHEIRVGRDRLQRGVIMQELAAGCVTQIRSVQPVGPYRIAGWSLGGNLTYEVAYQLLGQDEAVDFIGLIDSGARAPLPVPVHQFTTDGSFDRLAAALARALTQVESDPPPAIASHKAAVSIQSGPSPAVIVFCVPGAGANVTSFLSLADALGASCDVIGLCARGHENGSIPHTSVEAAAKAYIRDVRAITPREPYHLLGHSFGGWIAFEMARQLSATGASVAPVVLVDTEIPNTCEWSDRLGVLRRFIEVIELDLGRSVQLPAEQLMFLDEQAQLERLLGRLIAAKVLPARTRLATLSDIVRVFEAHLNTSYIPAGRWDGRILRLNAEQQSAEDLARANASTSWSDYVAEVGDVTLAGTNHFSILQAPHVGALVAEIKKVWPALR